MYRFWAYAWPRISRYMLPGSRVIVGGRSKGRALFNPSRMGGRTGKALSVTRCVARISMLLVKLGGSVLTEKARLRTPRRAAIRRLAAERGSVRQPLVCVQGGGSFGDVLASGDRLTD